MTSVRLGRFLFLLGLAVMAASTLTGRSVQPALTELGLAQYQATHAGPGALLFLLFVMGFPIGLCVSLMGVVLAGGERWSRAWLFGALALPGVGIVTAYPAIIGKHPSAAYFGLGGTAILVLVTVVVWYWGAYRSRQPRRRQAGLDLQVVGYLCFALAAWNVCGFASVPALALFPEKMIALETGTFAVGQLKAVMALFVLGWLFTALGFRQTLRSGP